MSSACDTFRSTIAIAVLAALAGMAPRAQAQAFSPADIKGLTIWLDAGDVNGNGTNPPAGSLVQTWKNKAGGFDAGQSAEGLRPKIVRDAESGRDVVRFERLAKDSPRFLEFNNNAIAALLDKTNTAFAVARPNSGGGGPQNVGSIVFARPGFFDGLYFCGHPLTTSAGYNRRLVPIDKKNIAVNLECDGGELAVFSRIETGSTNSGPSTIQLWRRDRFGAKATERVSDDAPLWNHGGSSPLLLGCAAPGGAWSWGLTGDIAEILFYDRALSDTERLQVENYMYARWFPKDKNSIVVYPKENNDVLFNPGKGWIVYSVFSNASDAAWAKASVGYTRFHWKNIHTGDNTFNWKLIDDMRAECVKRGKGFAFGIMPMCDATFGMPEWVVAAGARSVGGSKQPVWDDPVFIAKMGQLVTALTKRYNGDPAIEYIDLRTYGNWGEWWGGGGSGDPGDAVKRKYIDQWAGFDKTHIILPISGGSGVRHGPEDHGFYARDKYGFGCREDSATEGARWEYTHVFLDGLNAGPAVAEVVGPYLTHKWAWTEEALRGAVSKGGYSYLPLGEWNNKDADTFLADNGKLVDELQNKMGYWFKITYACYPGDLANGASGKITLRIRNDGGAPIPMKGNTAVVKMALMDNSTNVLSVTTLKGVNPCDWKPGAAISTADLSFPRQAKATKLALGVFSKESVENPDIKLGIDHGTALNWYVLSDMPRDAEDRKK